MGHIHDVYDADKHFIIDPVTRTITYSESDKLILIQNDHNSERYTFEMPKMERLIIPGRQLRSKASVFLAPCTIQRPSLKLIQIFWNSGRAKWLLQWKKRS